MSDTPGLPAFTSRRAGRWPGRPLLISRLREILKREFGAIDAWVVQTPGQCRLETRVGWRVVVLLKGNEDTFWAPFYTSAVRNVRRAGRLVAELAPSQRPKKQLAEVLRPMCEAAGVRETRSN